MGCDRPIFRRAPRIDVYDVIGFYLLVLFFLLPDDAQMVLVRIGNKVLGVLFLHVLQCFRVVPIGFLRYILSFLQRLYMLVYFVLLLWW